ncbi:MAG: hypothetical protein ORN58_00180 [Sediminibacterium sp.]|nr:hypothetical protein [Sediminibacterium sp.]
MKSQNDLDLNEQLLIEKLRKEQSLYHPNTFRGIQLMVNENYLETNLHVYPFIFIDLEAKKLSFNYTGKQYLIIKTEDFINELMNNATTGFVAKEYTYTEYFTILFKETQPALEPTKKNVYNYAKQCGFDSYMEDEIFTDTSLANANFNQLEILEKVNEIELLKLENERLVKELYDLKEAKTLETADEPTKFEKDTGKGKKK